MGRDSEIKHAEEQLRQAMLASDVEALDELLAPDLVFTNHLGQRLGKEADLSAHKTGALDISELAPSEQQISLIGDDTAVVSMRVRVAGTYAGQAAGGDFRFTRVWAQAPDGRWQVVAAHAGTVGEQNAPDDASKRMAEFRAGRQNNSPAAGHSMAADEIAIPPEALTDPQAFELMRLWAAHEQLHVTINSDISGSAEDFGELLADLFEHASRMFSQRDRVPLAACRDLMLDDFLRRVGTPKGSIEGSIPVEH